MKRKQYRNQRGSLRGFLALSEEEKRRLLVGNGKSQPSLDVCDYNNVLAVCNQFPNNVQVDYECRVDE